VLPSATPSTRIRTRPFAWISVIGLLGLFTPAQGKEEAARDPNTPVSFYKEIRPILQANCVGCHQPAKAKGDYIMTDFCQAAGRR
jgi:mono/diheme cytochrome c family protein